MKYNSLHITVSDAKPQFMASSHFTFSKATRTRVNY